MKYDIAALPVGSRERAVAQFGEGDLSKAIKTCGLGHIDRQLVHDELVRCIESLQSRKQFGTILSAYYKHNSWLTKPAGDNDFVVDIKGLLREIFTNNEMPGFLKQAYRFGIYWGLEGEIEQAILWHEARNLPDASAWKIKFYKLSKSTKVNEVTTQPLELLQIENEHRKLQIRAMPKVATIQQPVKVDFPKIEDTYLKSEAARIKTERANDLHVATLATLEISLRRIGVEVTATKLIDAFAEVNSREIIFEVKSINKDNERSQVRHAVSQLFEYKYLYQLEQSLLCVVLSERPYTQWLVDYLLNEHNMLVVWIENNSLTGPSAQDLLSGNFKV